MAAGTNGVMQSLPVADVTWSSQDVHICGVVIEEFRNRTAFCASGDILGVQQQHSSGTQTAVWGCSGVPSPTPASAALFTARAVVTFAPDLNDARRCDVEGSFELGVGAEPRVCDCVTV